MGIISYTIYYVGISRTDLFPCSISCSCYYKESLQEDQAHEETSPGNKAKLAGNGSLFFFFLLTDWCVYDSMVRADSPRSGDLSLLLVVLEQHLASLSSLRREADTLREQLVLLSQ